MSRAKALLDACVLHPFHLRNLIIQLAFDDVIEVFWSDEISKEWMQSVSQAKPSIPLDGLRSQLNRMNAVLPAANVTGWDQHVARITELPDDGDRHVVAAAKQAGAQYVVTWNLGDFPREIMLKHGLVAQDPDNFLTMLLRAETELVCDVVDRARLNLTRSAPDMAAYLDVLENQRVTRFVAELREIFAARR